MKVYLFSAKYVDIIVCANSLEEAQEMARKSKQENRDVEFSDEPYEVLEPPFVYRIEE